MAKKLIKSIANKFKKMSEEVKNTVESEENQPKEQNTTTETGAADNASAENTAQQTDNVAADPAKVWEDKYNELNDKYLRLHAEFDNYKRRTARERIELIATSNAEMLKAMLPVLDDFDRGFKTMEKADNVLALREGVELIYNKLKNTLASKGLEEMKSIGEPFDADVHEAITNVPAGDEMVGKVVDEVEKGYALNGKVIRYAKVVVGN
jgi:molecular chaperone GrpE